MSFFRRVFRRSEKEDPNVRCARAIQHFSSVENILTKKREHLDAQIKTETGNAIRLSKQGNEREALLAFKKKKRYEKTLIQVDEILTALESQREALQNAWTNKEVFDAVSAAAAALKGSTGGLSADRVTKLKDYMDEQLRLADEFLNTMFSPGFSVPDLYNDADLLAELYDLTREADLPINKMKEKERLQRELEAWANS